MSQIITNGNIVKHFAWTLRSTAVYFSFLNIIEEVIFVAMTAKTLRTRPNRSAILAFTIPKVDVESVFSCLSHLILELFELLLIHHFSIICISHNTRHRLSLFYVAYLTYSRYACTCFAASPPMTNLSISVINFEIINCQILTLG